MAVDLSIEVFSYDLFNTIWIQSKIIDSAPSSSEVFKEHCGDPNLNEDILKAVNCRQFLFHDLYQKHFDFWNVRTFNGPSDFFYYINYEYKHHFKVFSVFEFVLATCAHVAELGLYCCSNGNFSFIKYAYLCWAMFVDTTFKSQFYKSGGWFVLKYTARTYTIPLILLNIHKTLGGTSYFGKVHMDKFLTGMVDYSCFAENSNAPKDETRARTWVDFQFQNEAVHHNMAQSRAVLESAFNNDSFYGLELFLRDLKQLCDPLATQFKNALNYRRKEMNSEHIVSSVNDDLEKNTANTFACEVMSSRRKNGRILDCPETNASTKAKQVSDLKNFDQKECVLQKITSSENKDFEIKPLKPSEISEDINHLDVEEPPINEFHDFTPCPTSENVITNQEGNAENPKRRFNRLISKADGLMNLSTEKLLILHDKCIAGHENAEEEVKNANTGAKPKTKPTSKKVKNSNECSPKSKAPTTGHETPNAVKNKKNKKCKGDKSKAISPIPFYVNPDGTSEPNSYPDETKDFLRMLLVLGCQPGLNYMQSTFNNTKKIKKSSKIV